MPFRRAARSAHLLFLVPVLLVGSLAVPTGAAAAPAERYVDERVELPVGRIDSSTGILVFNGIFSRDGRGQDLTLWAPDANPEGDPVVFRADPSRSPRYELAEASFAAFVPLVGENGDAAGDAEIRAQLVATAERKPVTTRDRSGTSWFREVGWTEQVSASGTVTFPGGQSFAFADVAGAVTIVETFRTHPDADTLSERYSFVLAFMQGEDAFAAMAMFLGEGVTTRVELLLIPSDPSLPPLVAETAIPARDPFGVLVEVPVGSPESPVEGMATIDLALAKTGKREVFKARTATSLRTVVEEVLAAQGTLTFPGGFTFDLSSAEATLVTAHTSFSDPDGGRPAGPAPVNDGVRGALPLDRGDTVKGVWTGGAALLPEETFSEALGHTVWYRIEGDGAPFTVDTRGSDFDTVISLHRDVGNGLEPLGEFDDEIIGRTDAALLVQARTTFETEVGVAYYVQVGGFAFPTDGGLEAESGRLRVAVTGG